MGGQTLIVSGAGGITTNYNGATNTLTITGSGGGGTPAGSSFQVQYNNAGAFGAEAEFNYDPTDNELVVGTTTALAALHGRGRNDTGVGVILAENFTGNNIIEVKSNGKIKLGDNESYPYFYQSATAGGSVSYTANGITFYSEPAATTGTDLYSFYHPSSALTTGAYNIVRQTGTWAPSSGTATYNGIVSDPTINQTSTASGRIKLIKGNPTVTQSTGGIDVFSASASITAASGGLRGYYSDINSGTGIYQMYLDGTAISRFDGEVGIKTDPASGFDLHVVGNQRNDARLLIRGTGTPVSSSAASSVAMQNTTAGTGDTWYVGSMNDGTFVLQSGNASTVMKAQTDGTVETIYDLQIDFLNSTPTKVIGVDNTGVVGQVTLGTDVTLSAGELPLWNSNDAGVITSLTATALADVTGLSFAVTANKKYEFWATIKYSAAATTTGSAWSINGPAGTVSLRVESGLTATTSFNHWQNAVNTLSASASSVYTSGNIAYVHGIVEPTASGTYIIRGATEVASSSITVQGTSNINWREIK